MPPPPLPVARAAVELDASQGAPEWVRVMDAGAVAARDGRRWTLSDPAGVVAASLARAAATDIVVDYEHQTDHALRNGRPAPAAGWVRELAARDGGIWARVEWTDRARTHIEAREYRYLSPTFAYARDGAREVRAIHRLALTNAPAFDLPALAREEEDAMPPEDLAALAAALGLAKDAGPGDVLARAKALVASAAALAAALGVAEDAPAAEVLAAAKARAAAPAPGEFVPRAEFDRVAGDLAGLRKEQAEERATAAVDEATAAGKVSPAQRDWALGYARADLDGFRAFAAAAPAVLDPAPIGPPAPAGRDPKAPLDADETALCRAMGITAEQFQASREELVERGYA